MMKQTWKNMKILQREFLGRRMHRSPLGFHFDIFIDYAIQLSHFRLFTQLHPAKFPQGAAGEEGEAEFTGKGGAFSV